MGFYVKFVFFWTKEIIADDENNSDIALSHKVVLDEI